jgi:hypothetical protein
MFDRLRSTIANLISKNSMTLPLGRRFLKYGVDKMYPNWSEVVMTDQDHYSGHSYAAIRNRANQVNVIKDHITTKTDKDNSDFVHPYLTLIKESPNFSAFWFWLVISTYLDLEGVFYLLVVRNYNDSRRGAVKEFKLLNPYKIRRVINQETMEVAGYIETRGTMTRELPKEMVIEIRELNPFDWNEPYAMTDAAKESNFTLKTAGDYTRHALKSNINSPGIITTDIMLPEEKFKNFAERIKNHTKGEPLFGNGAGTIKWDPMQTELAKAALKDVNEINRDSLFSVAGMSKTMMGIEQSGTTRETSRVQKDLLTEMQTLPRIQLILDALNQDYKINYPQEYETNGKPMLEIQNPNKTDHEAEKADVEVKQSRADLYSTLIDKGYKPQIAADYVSGKIDIAGLGKPTEEPKQEPIIPEDSKKKESARKVFKNQRELIQNQQTALQNAVVNIEEQLVVRAINKIPLLIPNAINRESDLLTIAERRAISNELSIILDVFYNTIFIIEGEAHINERSAEYGMEADFAMDKGIKMVLESLAQKVAKSHVDTVSKDIYATARELALQKKSQQEIISGIRQKYTAEISTIRARAIARTETQRAFTESQLEADKQFARQNGLEGRVYKKWVINSDNPCAICETLASEDAIPLDDPFRGLNSDVKYIESGKNKSYKVNFTSIEAGTAHPNCYCSYDFIVRPE